MVDKNQKNSKRKSLININDKGRIDSNYNFILPISDDELKVKIINNAFSKPESIDEIMYYKTLSLEGKNDYKINFLKNINFTQVWKTYTFNELVLYWQNNITKLAKEEGHGKRKHSDVPDPKIYAKAGEGIFKSLEEDKLLLLFQTNHIEPTICSVRNQVYRQALILACFQDAIKIGMLDLGVGITEGMSKHLLFPRYIYEWGFIKALIYENEDLAPRKLTDEMLQHLQDADFRERIRRFDMFDKELTPQIRPREPDSLSDIKEANDWKDVQISLKLIIAGSFGVRVKLNNWDKSRDYQLKDFGFLSKEGKLNVGFQKFILMAFNGYYLSEKNSNQKVLQNQLNKINKSFKDAFGIKEDPIYYNQESKVYTYKFDILKIDGKADYKHFSHSLYYDQAVAPDESPKQLLFNEIKIINEKYQSNEKLEPDEHQNLSSYWTRFIQPLRPDIIRPSDIYDEYLNELEGRLHIEKEFTKRLNNE